MLLDLCEGLSRDGDTVSAGMNSEAVRLPDETSGEQGYPAFLLAEAFAQIACRSAQLLSPLEGRRYLPATTKSFEIVEFVETELDGARLTAESVRVKPLLEFACNLISSGKTVIARATVVVAPAPLPETGEAQS